MSTYARIQNGIVAELFSPPANVPIAQCFAPGLTWVECDGTPGVAPGWTAAESNGAWTFTAPPEPPAPSLAQQAASALAAGVTITLTGSVTLAATIFPCDPGTQTKIEALASMAARGVLPTGATGYAMEDAAGTWHEFNAAQYQALAGAISAYVAALILIADGNPLGVTTLPSSSITVSMP